MAVICRTGSGTQLPVQPEEGRDQGNGNQALLQFLAKGKGGRVGYCEQFASAFAVMARTLDLPARVAIGFLKPHQVGSTTTSTARTTCTPGPRCTSAARAGCGSSPRRGSGRRWLRRTPSGRQKGGSGPKDSPTTKGGSARQRPDQCRDQAPQRRQHLLELGLLRPRALGLDPRWARRAGGPRRHRPRARCRTPRAPQPAPGRRRRAGLARAARHRRRPRCRLAGQPVTARDGLPARGVVRTGTGRCEAGAAAARPRSGPRCRGRPRPDRADPGAGALRPVRRRRPRRPGRGRAHLHRLAGARLHARHPAARGWLPRSLFGRSRRSAMAEMEREPEAVAAGGVIDHVG